jgi:hypothetical protein
VPTDGRRLLSIPYPPAENAGARFALAGAAAVPTQSGGLHEGISLRRDDRSHGPCEPGAALADPIVMIFAAAGALIGALLLALLVWCAPDDSPCHGA